MNDFMNSIVNHALIFASIAHRGQKRKYTDEPYIVHCYEVVKILEAHNSEAFYNKAYNDMSPFYKPIPDCVLAAAAMHDVIEDTNLTEQDIEIVFGEEISGLVIALTDYPVSLCNREMRKKMDRERIATSSNYVKSIKCADLISNTNSIVEHDPNFARVYLKEKELLLKESLIGAYEPLYQQAIDSLNNAKAKLGMT